MAKWITNSEEEVKTTAGELGWGKVVALSVGALVALTARKEEKTFLKTLAILGLVLGAVAYVCKNATINIGWSYEDDDSCDCGCDCGDECQCGDDCDCGDDCSCKTIKHADIEAEDLAD